MNIRIFVVLTVLLLSSLACNVSVGDWDFDFKTVEGSGVVVTEDYQVSEFSRLDFSGMGHVIIEIGEKESLRVEAEDNLLEYFEIEVRNETLHIGIKKDTNLRPTEDVNFYLTVLELDAIYVSGLGDIDAPAFEVKRFDARISGAGDINISQLTADELQVGISGLGTLSIDDGRVQNQTIEISGSGNY